MTWLRLDDGFGEHEKVDALSDGAYRLHVQGMCLAARLGTDGLVRRSRVERLTPKFKASYITELVNSGVWEVHNEGWMIHDFLDYNPSAEQVRERKERRAEAGSKGGKKAAGARAKGQASATAGALADSKARTPSVPSSHGSTPARPEGLRAGTSGTLVAPETAPAPQGVAVSVVDPEPGVSTFASPKEAAECARKALNTR